MRRRVPAVVTVPARLDTFDPDDWPGAIPVARVLAWAAARRAWADEHGWPRGALSQLREEHAARRRAQGQPLPNYDRPLRRLAHHQQATEDAAQRPGAGEGSAF